MFIFLSSPRHNLFIVWTKKNLFPYTHYTTKIMRDLFSFKMHYKEF